MATSAVSLISVSSDLTASFARAMELAGLGEIVAPGHKVLVKPNMHGGEGYTSPQVMRAAVEWAFMRGAVEVWLGDGPVWTLADATDYFRRTGLLAVCEATGARPVQFHQGDYRLLHPQTPDLPETIGVSEYLYQADVVINLPLMKTHFNTLVTLGLKNLKGCLRPIDKKTLHEMELNAALAEVARLLKPQVTATVLDAVTAMEGMGPSAATPVDMGLLLASRDVVAVDSVACDLMGIDPQQVRLIRFASERSVGNSDLATIAVVGEDPAHHRRRFRLPYEALVDNFPELKLCSERACSGCSMNLFRALEIARAYGQGIQFDTVVIGSGVVTEGQTLLVGNCTRQGWGKACHVPGCPPWVDAIRVALTGIEADKGLPRT